MKTYLHLLIISSLFLSGCFTIPGKDRFIYTDSFVNEDLGCIRPLPNPIEQIEYISTKDQSFWAKARYINQCMINYSHGQGWNNRTDF